MIRIGDFAKICNVSKKTLRYYDDEGILKADATDRATGYRFYSLEAVEKYKKIVFYKELGFSLQEIKKIQAADREEQKVMLKQKKANLLLAVEQIQKQIQTINAMFAEDGGQTMTGPLFQSRAHQIHAEQEQAEAADQLQYIKKTHNMRPSLFII